MEFFHTRNMLSKKEKEDEDRLEQIKAQALEQIKASDMPEKLNEVRVKFLGKKGELTAVLKGMKDVAPEERPKSRTAGQ